MQEVAILGQDNFLIKKIHAYGPPRLFWTLGYLDNDWWIGETKLKHWNKVVWFARNWGINVVNSYHNEPWQKSIKLKAMTLYSDAFIILFSSITINHQLRELWNLTFEMTKFFLMYSPPTITVASDALGVGLYVMLLLTRIKWNCHFQW